MTIPSNIRPFWDEFQASIDFDASSRFYEVFHFDDNEATGGSGASEHGPFRSGPALCQAVQNCASIIHTRSRSHRFFRSRYA